MYRIAATLLLLPLPVIAAQLECRVIGISDGDTINCLTADRVPERIRLRGIDAPESKQPFGAQSKQHLSGLVYRRTVIVDSASRDRWGRIIGTVWVEPADCVNCGPTLDAGRAQLASGMAWWFRRYAKQQPLEERLSYEFEEKEALTRRIGLWRDPQPIPPWDWRRGKR
ncbi:thermonuclease family protein [Pseudomonas phenolilytica]|uniref:thermonuclease family protein n=1 Tax=Pseudomonas phenolilytica TaxID=2746321 RepID=UPI001F26AA2D|nr:thermonuclease family protein [Pseudomonas phenolilytica]UIP88451.1 thermonuclease family protein [Pseudomonas phenolilytica]